MGVITGILSFKLDCSIQFAHSVTHFSSKGFTNHEYVDWVQSVEPQSLSQNMLNCDILLSLDKQKLPAEVG